MRTSLYYNLFQNCNPLNLLLKARSINMGNFYWKKWYFIEVQEWLKLDRSQPLFYFISQEKNVTVKLARLCSWSEGLKWIRNFGQWNMHLGCCLKVKIVIPAPSDDIHRLCAVLFCKSQANTHTFLLWSVLHKMQFDFCCFYNLLSHFSTLTFDASHFSFDARIFQIVLVDFSAQRLHVQ